MERKEKRKHLLSCCIIFLGFSACLNAQVTIGSGEIPNDGALLDLKQNNNEGHNSILGMILPRVELEDLNSLAPCLNTTPSDPKTYKGLMVYNVEPALDSDKGEGIYIWDGGEWVYTPSSRSRSQISQ